MYFMQIAKCLCSSRCFSIQRPASTSVWPCFVSSSYVAASTFSCHLLLIDFLLFCRFDSIGNGSFSRFRGSNCPKLDSPPGRRHTRPFYLSLKFYQKTFQTEDYDAPLPLDRRVWGASASSNAKMVFLKALNKLKDFIVWSWTYLWAFWFLLVRSWPPGIFDIATTNLFLRSFLYSTTFAVLSK